MAVDLDLEVKAISNAPIFSGLDPAKMRLMACMSERLSFAAGEYLYRAGDISDSVYLILQGDVEFTAQTGNGQVVIDTSTAGAIIGEVALLCDDVYFISARAATPLRTIRIKRDCLLRMMQDCPRFSMSIARELAKRIRRLSQLHEAHISH